MSSICGVIDCNNKLSTNEYLQKLSRETNSNTKSTYSKTNIHNTFVGICANNNDHIESIIYRGVKYTCAFYGELYNADELSEKISVELGYDPMEAKNSQAIVTWSYILWGGFSPRMLEGKFAYAIYSEGIFKTSPHTPRMFLARDCFGFIPIYYITANHEFTFSTSLGAILKSQVKKVCLDIKGIWQIFYLDGKSLPGYTHIKDIFELYPGCCAYLDCRDSCKIMIKSYVNNTTSPLYDTNISKLLEESYIRRRIKNNTKMLEYKSDISTPEIIEESVRATNYPILPNIYQSIKNTETNNELYCNVGCELINTKQNGMLKGFFPWIHDPYYNLDIVRNESLNFRYGFEFINTYRQDIVDTLTDSYYRESVYRFYLPMILKHIESCADNCNISVKYPFCDKYIYLYSKQNGEICDDSIFSKNSFAFEYNGDDNTKESEYATALFEKLEKLSMNSDSIINYICDKNILMDAIKRGTNVKALSLLYATHCFAEEFSLDFTPCRDC